MIELEAGETFFETGPPKVVRKKIGIVSFKTGKTEKYSGRGMSTKELIEFGDNDYDMDPRV